MAFVSVALAISDLPPVSLGNNDFLVQLRSRTSHLNVWLAEYQLSISLRKIYH